MGGASTGGVCCISWGVHEGGGVRGGGPGVGGGERGAQDTFQTSDIVVVSTQASWWLLTAGWWLLAADCC